MNVNRRMSVLLAMVYDSARWLERLYPQPLPLGGREELDRERKDVVTLRENARFVLLTDLEALIREASIVNATAKDQGLAATLAKFE